MTLKEVLSYDIHKLEQISIPIYLSNTVGAQISGVISDLNACCDFLDQEAEKIKNENETTENTENTESVDEQSVVETEENTSA